MKFVKLTRPSGTMVYVNMDHVLEIIPDRRGTGSELITTQLFSVDASNRNGWQYHKYDIVEVIESPELVAELANEESYDIMEVDPSEDR